MDRQINTKFHLIAAGIVIACSVGLLICDGIQRVSLNRQLTTVQEQYQKAQKLLENTQSKLLNAEYQRAKDSSDPTLTANANVQEVYSDLSSTANNFFKIMWTYNSQSSYEQRATKVKKYASDDVANNSTLFGSGKGSTGDNFIEAQQIESSFNSVTLADSSLNDDGTVQAIATVSATVAYAGSTGGTTTTQYLVTYNPTLNQITACDYLGVTGSTSTD